MPGTARNRPAARDRAIASPVASGSALARNRARSAGKPAPARRERPPYSAISPQFAQVRQPIERPLQDENRRVLIDHLCAPGAAHVHADQFALDSGGREPLVPQGDAEIGEPGKGAGEGTGRLRAWSFAGVHVDRQAEYEAYRAAFAGNGDQPRRIGLEGLAPD